MKKKTYTLQDGDTIIASCASEFVTQLRLGSRFDSECTDAEYMVSFAERYRQQTTAVIRSDTAENFLYDLSDSGYISDVK